MRSRLRWAALALTIALAVAVAAPASACPVCYGEASGSVIDGTRLSVVFLGGLVYLVLFGGVGMVFMARRRALRSLQAAGGPPSTDDHDDDDQADRPRPADEETSA